MARIDWVEQRLQNWARWHLMRGSGTMGYAGVDWDSMADADAGRDGYITASIPVSDLDASETQEVVARLPSELRATVEENYLGNGLLREKCARLFISEDTLLRRIERAHRMMAQHWGAKRDAQEVERQRLEQLRQQAAPKGFYTAG